METFTSRRDGAPARRHITVRAREPCSVERIEGPSAAAIIASLLDPLHGRGCAAGTGAPTMSEPRYDHPLTPWTGSGEDHGNGARLELKPNFPRTGFVDGGWWPRSRDLRAELPDLIASLSAQLGGRVGPILRI